MCDLISSLVSFHTLLDFLGICLVLAGPFARPVEKERKKFGYAFLLILVLKLLFLFPYTIVLTPLTLFAYLLLSLHYLLPLKEPRGIRPWLPKVLVVVPFLLFFLVFAHPVIYITRPPEWGMSPDTFGQISFVTFLSMLLWIFHEAKRIGSWLGPCYIVLSYVLAKISGDAWHVTWPMLPPSALMPLGLHILVEVSWNARFQPQAPISNYLKRVRAWDFIPLLLCFLVFNATVTAPARLTDMTKKEKVIDYALKLDIVRSGSRTANIFYQMNALGSLDALDWVNASTLVEWVLYEIKLGRLTPYAIIVLDRLSGLEKANRTEIIEQMSLLVKNRPNMEEVRYALEALATIDSLQSINRSDVVQWILNLSNPVYVDPYRQYAAWWGSVSATYNAVVILKILDALDLLNQSRTIEWIQAAQLPSGGFFYAPDLRERPYVITTYDAIETLELLNALDQIDVEAASKWLIGMQSYDGGFSRDVGNTSSIEGTFYAIRALKSLRYLEFLNEKTRLLQRWQASLLLKNEQMFLLPAALLYVCMTILEKGSLNKFQKQSLSNATEPESSRSLKRYRVPLVQVFVILLVLVTDAAIDFSMIPHEPQPIPRPPVRITQFHLSPIDVLKEGQTTQLIVTVKNEDPRKSHVVELWVATGFYIKSIQGKNVDGEYKSYERLGLFSKGEERTLALSIEAANLGWFPPSQKPEYSGPIVVSLEADGVKTDSARLNITVTRGD